MIASLPSIVTALPHAHRVALARLRHARWWWAESRERWDADLRAWQEGVAG